MASFSDFDAAYYLAQNPDVAASGLDPLDHFQRWGITENRAPNAGIANAAQGGVGATPYGDAWNFNMTGATAGGGLLDPYGSDYLAANPDVAAALRSGQLSSAWDHYNTFGKNEGRTWEGGIAAALNPTTGSATFGGPSYASTVGMADAVSGYNGAAQGGRPATGAGAPTPATGGLGAVTPATDPYKSYFEQQQQLMQQQQTSMQSMMDSWQKGLSAKPGGSAYNPTGVGGSFSNVNSPVYRPGGASDGNRAPVNGTGGMFAGNGPFRATF